MLPSYKYFLFSKAELSKILGMFVMWTVCVEFFGRWLLVRNKERKAKTIKGTVAGSFVYCVRKIKSNGDSFFFLAVCYLHCVCLFPCSNAAKKTIKKEGFTPGKNVSSWTSFLCRNLPNEFIAGLQYEAACLKPEAFSRSCSISETRRTKIPKQFTRQIFLWFT